MNYRSVYKNRVDLPICKFSSIVELVDVEYEVTFHLPETLIGGISMMNDRSSSISSTHNLLFTGLKSSVQFVGTDHSRHSVHSDVMTS